MRLFNHARAWRAALLAFGLAWFGPANSTVVADPANGNHALTSLDDA